MDCNEIRSLVHPYVDGELDFLKNLEIEQHLATCAACAQTLKGLQTLRTTLCAGSLRYQAPMGLQKRIRSALQRELRPKRTVFPVPWRILGVAASFFLVIPLTWSLARINPVSAPDDLLAKEVVYGHVRSLMSKDPVDVVSSDQHTVKPWFTGKLDFSPPVKDLAEQGFPLIGGRTDYLDDRPVAALLYGRHQHKINLFIWPSANESVAKVTTQTRQGYHLIHWTESGMTCWAISDLNMGELQQFAELIQK